MIRNGNRRVIQKIEFVITNNLLQLQTRNVDVANWCTPYAMNWRIIIRITNAPIARTPMLHVSYVRHAMSEMEDNAIQKVGRVGTRRRRGLDYTRHENSTRGNK